MTCKLDTILKRERDDEVLWATTTRCRPESDDPCGPCIYEVRSDPVFGYAADILIPRPRPLGVDGRAIGCCLGVDSLEYDPCSAPFERGDPCSS